MANIGEPSRQWEIEIPEEAPVVIPEPALVPEPVREPVGVPG